MRTFLEFVKSRMEPWDALPPSTDMIYSPDVKRALTRALVELSGVSAKAEAQSDLDWLKTEGGKTLAAVCAEATEDGTVPTGPRLRQLWANLKPRPSAAEWCQVCISTPGWEVVTDAAGNEGARRCTCGAMPPMVVQC